MLHFGWKAGAEQYPPVALLEQAETAESVGFDCIDISDHFHPWSEEGQASFAWTWLGAAAVKTTRIHMGTGVTCPILRYHPSIVAQAAATVACFAPGRTFLAVGTGEALNEYSATGEWPAYQARQDRMIEAIEMIRALWTGERVTHHGVYYRTQQAKLYTSPPGPIPLYVSALVPNSAAVAGRYGDGLITVGGHPPHVYRSLLERFEVGAREAGKDPARLPRMVELNVSYANDERAALASLKAYWAGTFIPALFSERIYTPKVSAENGQAVGNDTMRATGCISNNPDAHVAFARQYIELGFTHLIFHSAGPDQDAFLRGYGADVLPQLRQLMSPPLTRR